MTHFVQFFPKGSNLIERKILAEVHVNKNASVGDILTEQTQFLGFVLERLEQRLLFFWNVKFKLCFVVTPKIVQTFDGVCIFQGVIILNIVGLVKNDFFSNIQYFNDQCFHVIIEIIVG